MLNLNIPEKIKIKIFENWILIEGPLGILKKKKSSKIQMFIDHSTNKLYILNINLKEKHFYLALLNKMILGVLKGFSIRLNIVGVGYKVFLNKNTLTLKLGMSHLISYEIPENIKIKILSHRGLSLNIFGNDFQKVTQVAANIRALKPAEPYKGKGIQYSNEIVKRKEGKKTNV